MLSRVAERLYWFARYVERAENTARLLLVRHQLILDLPMTIQPGWDLLIDVLGARDIFAARSLRPTEKNIVSFVFGDRDNPASIYSSLAFARENMRTTREVMPAETWERINSLYLSVARRGRTELARNARHKVLSDIIQRCQQITGMLAGSMNHEESYQFIRIGRNLERGDMSTRIIDVGSAQLQGEDEETSPYRNALWVSVLKSLSAYQMYRLSVRRNVHAEDALGFLLMSTAFPRALMHTLVEIETSLNVLPHNETAAKVVRSLIRRLKRADISRLRGPELHEFMDVMQQNMERVHRAVQATWFTPEQAA